MSPKRYSQEELQQLLFEFNQSTPLSKLEIMLERPASGIVQKMQALSKQDPDSWNPEKVGGYRKEQQRRWYHQWYQQHKDKIREQQRQYREQHRDETREQRRQWYHEGGGREQQRQYREQHRDELREQRRQLYQQHKDKIREQQRQYREQYKDKIREQQRQYREQYKKKWQEFGNLLSDLLETYNGKKKEFAKEFGIHPSLLSHYLAGDKKPNEEFLKNISERFGIHYETLQNLVR